MKKNLMVIIAFFFSRSLLASGDIVITGAPEGGVQVGQGWNSIKDTPTTGLCMDVSEKTTYDKNEATLWIKNVSDEISAANTTETSVSAKAKNILGTGVSASYNFLKTVTRESDARTTKLYVKMERVVGSVVAGFPINKNKMTVKDEITNLNPVDFYNQCGDTYVAAIHYGASVHGALISQNNATKEALKEQKNADIKFSGTKVSVGVSNLQQLSAISDRFRLLYAEEGLATRHKTPTTAKSLLKIIEDFPYLSDTAFNKKRGNIMQVVLKKYPDATARTLGDSNLGGDLERLKVAVEFYGQLADLNSGLREVGLNQKYYKFFGEYNYEKVKSAETEAAALLESTKSFISTCTIRGSCGEQTFNEKRFRDLRAYLPISIQQYEEQTKIGELRPKVERLRKQIASKWSADVGHGSFSDDRLTDLITMREQQISSAKRTLSSSHSFGQQIQAVKEIQRRSGQLNKLHTIEDLRKRILKLERLISDISKSKKAGHQLFQLMKRSALDDNNQFCRLQVGHALCATTQDIEDIYVKTIWPLLKNAS